jgi:hypothetical protein
LSVLWPLVLLPALAPGVAGQGQEASEPACLLTVEINPESRVKVERGITAPILTRGAWETFRIRVRNDARVTAPLRLSSPNTPAGASRDRWLDIRLETNAPLTGAPSEVRRVRLRSRDEGRREAALAFDVGQGTQDIGFRGEVALLFTCRESRPAPKP